MCLESGERARRRKAALPLLHIQSGSASDAECEPAVLPPMPSRSSKPEIFTFDVESVRAVSAKPSRRGPMGPRGKRPRRVLYPAKTRKYLPRPETDHPLRWLYILCLVVCVQICCEEATPDNQLLPLEVVVPNVQPFADLPVLQEPEDANANYSQGTFYYQETNYSQSSDNHHQETNYSQSSNNNHHQETNYSQSSNNHHHHHQKTSYSHMDTFGHNDLYSQGDSYRLTALFNDTSLSWLYHQR